MDEFAREIFRVAIIKENAAYKLYTDLSFKVKSHEARYLLSRIAKDELMHKEIFSKMDVLLLKKLNPEEFTNLSLIKNKSVMSVVDINDINEVLDFAIKEEQKAFDDYNILVKHLPFGKARDAVKEIAIQEARHKTILQKIKLEFNDDS
ncbi:MAG: ferritin family protein [Nanoarchaeota archaeon]|nr:ferritin family protein [Nanoarchaeota archaeon]MBU1269311.1 ferritin family protein [Nanoarchaeota archaeon]MBU1603722.1 ferritin family protein [Nanoarchaeota archaeon]MBU2443332.1 ferritin family protein [Nanoarchaeota archaeon]